MTEANHDLPYRSETNAAHMCGHDGHTTSLLAFAETWWKNINFVPKNKTIRLVFQPAEEAIGGAYDMVQEGAMDGVQEVYGYHNWPTGKIG